MLRLELGDYAGARPYAAGLTVIRTGSEVGLHTHRDFAEVVYVVDGLGEHRVGTCVQPLRRGHTAFIRPEDQHSYRSLPRHSMTTINVAFPLRSLMSFFDACGMDPVPWMRAVTPPIAQTADVPGIGQQVAQQFESALEAFQGAPRGTDLVALMSTVFGELERVWHDTDVGRDVPVWLRAAVLAMDDERNLREGLTRLLDLAGVSHGHLARQVRRHYGHTCSQLVTAKRLDLAKVLLATTTDPVTVIAHRCGFSGAAYFIRLFRERFGTTPGASRATSAIASALGPVTTQRP